MAANGGNETAAWAAMVGHLWRFIVRPIAVGGMLVGACFTLYKMRKNLINGVKRSIADVKKSAAAAAATKRTEQDLSLKVVGLGIVVLFVLISTLYMYFTGTVGAAVVAAVVILVTGFFFAAVSGNLVGMIGSSNNPLSGLTLATTIVAALTMVLVGAKGTEGVLAVLGVAAVGCVSAAVAGEMLQDLKVGHILGGTPVEDAGGRPDRRRRGRPGDVLPALHDAHLRRRAVRRGRRVRRQDLRGAAGRA